MAIALTRTPRAYRVADFTVIKLEHRAKAGEPGTDPREGRRPDYLVAGTLKSGYLLLKTRDLGLKLKRRQGIVKLRLTAVSDPQHGGFTAGSSPVSWGSIDELFVNLTVPTVDVDAAGGGGPTATSPWGETHLPLAKPPQALQPR